MAKPVTAVIMGAGSRGRGAYGKYAENYPDRLNFIAVADPDEKKRKRFQELHDIQKERLYNSWEDLLSAEVGKIADVAFVCTPDRLHYQPAMRALELDYDVVLEKPIAPTLQECIDIANLAEKKNKLVQVCHVLRFTDFWKKVKEILDSGKLGRIIHYEHSENVAYWHFGHSFVRGFSKNKEKSTPIVLAKTCHDLDLIYWLLNEKSLEVHSTGKLTHYKPENAPEGAPDRCIEGCPAGETCPWNAVKLYIDAEPLLKTGLESRSKFIRLMTKGMIKHKGLIKFLGLFDKRILKFLNWDEFPVTAITNDFSIEGKKKALRDGPFGICVYNAGNDVPDRQVSTFTFPSGATATLTTHGFAEYEGREIRIFGSKGVLRGKFRFTYEEIVFTDFLSNESKLLYKKGLQGEAHGGGDPAIMDAFTSVMLGEKTKEEAGLTDVRGAIESHIMGFAAEESRVNNLVIKLENLRK